MFQRLRLGENSMKNIEFYYDELQKLNCTSAIFDFACEKGKFCRSGTSMEQYIIWWLNSEHQLLDDVEKRYLKNIIRPFAGMVTSIEKRSHYCGEYIVIAYRENEEENKIYLPNLQSETMYAGMKPNHKYTIEELGLLK